MFWLGINNNIENIVRNCNVCQQYHKQQQEKQSYLMKYWTFPGLKQAQIYLKVIQKVI